MRVRTQGRVHAETYALVATFMAVACTGRHAGIGERCDCDGQGVRICEGSDCGPCMCLPRLDPTEDPVAGATFFVDADALPDAGDGSAGSPWSTVDWAAVDAAVADADVLVVFDAGDVWERRVDVARTDAGPNRVVLHGALQQRTGDGWVSVTDGARAVVPGVHTGFDPIERHRITVRGFDITGSKDKGVLWTAGDEVIIEDNWVHHNAGSPSISLAYVSDSGLPSKLFTVRNNHVWSQRGECIYIGGARGEDLDAHERVVIENNLIHDCWHPSTSKTDGINIKDRIRSVLVTRNVIFNTDWGVEVASSGEYSHNLVWSTARNAYHLTDAWGVGLGGLRFTDNVAIDAGDAGAYLNATENPWDDVVIERFTAIASGTAGMEFGGPSGIAGTITDALVVGASVGFDAWDPMELEMGQCHVDGNDLDDDRDLAGFAADCGRGDASLGDTTNPAGPDAVFFTPDDPWLSSAGGAQL